MTDKLRAYGYVRVSVDEEAGNNASIAAQISAILAYAERENIEIVEIFQELHVSGRKLQRKQFDRMILQATSPEHPVHQVIVFALSRFARRLLTQVVSEHKLGEAGVRLISLAEGFADDPNGKLMRSMIAVMNEKYALDASLFTRRDRRGNARAGNWNGGPVPFGYQARTVAIEGRKERRRLFIVEEEAAIVRIIYQLALNGLDGQPMGTRTLAAHLNANGYSLRGRPFFHSNVDGILRREHYAGSYRDRTADDQGVTPSVDQCIIVACPQIIEPTIIAAVAALRAKAAPRVTPPRITNSPVMLGGIARCGHPGCDAGLTIRTGKGGRYAYYTCNHKATAGAARCSSKPIRQDMLDEIVLDGLLQRVLRPERLRDLLSDVLDRSDEADQRRRDDLDRVRRERISAEGRLRRLLEIVEEGLMDPRDAIFAERVAENRRSIAALRETERSLESQLGSGTHRIDDETVERFGSALRAQLLGENSAMRRAYVRLLVSSVTVNDNNIVVAGTKAALEHAAVRGAAMVPSFDRKWCPEELSAGQSKRLISQSNHRLAKSPGASIARFGFVEKAGRVRTGQFESQSNVICRSRDPGSGLDKSDACPKFAYIFRRHLRWFASQRSVRKPQTEVRSMRGFVTREIRAGSKRCVSDSHDLGHRL